MKKTYRIEERQYSDGSSRFYPKVHDWWHGWRYFGKPTVQDWVEDPGRVWFDTKEDANSWIQGVIAASKGESPSKPASKDRPVYIGAVYHEVEQ